MIFFGTLIFDPEFYNNNFESVGQDLANVMKSLY